VETKESAMLSRCCLEEYEIGLAYGVAHAVVLEGVATPEAGGWLRQCSLIPGEALIPQGVQRTWMMTTFR
jgi:hypothetical protein